MTTNFLCTTCGVQFSQTISPPNSCPICEDDRQYVNPAGQSWTTPEALQQTHHNYFSTIEPNLMGIHTAPRVAIGQRALLIQTAQGNVLWDCTPLLDAAAITTVNALGGIAAIAVSHPHLSSTLVDWSQAFGHAPIYWHAADRDWVMRPDPAFVFWKGDHHPVLPGVDLIRAGGHFPGSAVLHWRAGSGGKGVLLTGDTLMVGPDQKLSFMYSYPNLIPLSGKAVARIGQAVAPLAFDRIYGAWPHSVIETGAKQVVEFSVSRYLRMIEG